MVKDMKRKWIILLVVLMLFLPLTMLGKKEHLQYANHLLNQYTIFIDPGHGGKDNGASFNQIAEDEINLDIASLIYEQLLNYGAYAFLTRTGDYDLSDMYAKNHKLMDLNKRIRYITENKTDLFISIHLNSFSDCNVSGAQVFYKKNLDKSYDLAQVMQEKLNQLNKRDKKAKVGDFYLLNYTGEINGIMIECGFLSNPEERKQLVSASYQKRLSQLICEGILQYLSMI